MAGLEQGRVMSEPTSTAASAAGGGAVRAAGGVRADSDLPAPAGSRPVTRWDLIEAGIALAAFIVLWVVILRTAPFMPEPDDYAYRGSIVAMTDGHFLSLSTAQAQALVAQLSKLGSAARPYGRLGGGPVIAQWVHLANGRWISEKDPGFPFLAVVFQWLGIIRWDQLFYGAIACAGLPARARLRVGRSRARPARPTVRSSSAGPVVCPVVLADHPAASPFCGSTAHPVQAGFAA